jgi:aspartyl protease family protein
MATGFMLRHSIALLMLLAGLPASASEVSLIGTFGSTAAILSINGGAPKTVRVGQNFSGVTVVGVEQDRATVEIDGKRRVLQRGQTYSSAGGGASAQSVRLAAGAGGHFMAEGQVNGGAVRFVVDTGATMIALPASDAIRLRIDYRKGRAGTVNTAAGPTTAYAVTLESVRVGGIEMLGVEAVVIEQGLSVALLGNSFLSRTDMRLEGQTMTLTKRF